MSWHTINGRQYYYTSKRVGDRVETQYCGTASTADVLAEVDAHFRAVEGEEREVAREARERADAEERAIATWFNEIQAVADAALVAAGLHRHRGSWRRRRA